jgi:hypothetical protein
MHAARIKVFSEMGSHPSYLADTMTDRMNRWLLENGITYDDIDHFQANMTAGQDGENNDALWYCYTATIMYSEEDMPDVAGRYHNRSNAGRGEHSEPGIDDNERSLT